MSSPISSASAHDEDAYSSEERLSSGSQVRKGIVLAGGTGSRLYPLTRVVNKQLMPIYDKPMVYYPIATLMLAGIRDILVISTPDGRPQFEALLEDGSSWGVRFSYATQSRPEGIAQAFLIAGAFLAGAPSALILGDNVFYGTTLIEKLRRANARRRGATIFGYRVEDPQSYGVLSFGPGGEVTDIVEKPVRPPSDYAVTGLYFFDERVVEFAERLQPSSRGELEITDLNRLYLDCGDLGVELLGRGFAWLDAGTPESLLDASDFIRTLESRQGLRASCPEEVAFRMGYIDQEQLLRLSRMIDGSPYGRYLQRVAEDPGWEWHQRPPRTEPLPGTLSGS